VNRFDLPDRNPGAAHPRLGAGFRENRGGEGRGKPAFCSGLREREISAKPGPMADPAG